MLLGNAIYINKKVRAQKVVHVKRSDGHQIGNANMSYIASVSRADKLTPSLLTNSGCCGPVYRPDRTRTEVNSEGVATDQSFINPIPYCHRRLPSGTVKAVSETGILRVVNGRNQTPLVQNIKAKGKSENTDDLLTTTSINQNRLTKAANAARVRTHCLHLQSRKISQNGKNVTCDAKVCETKDQKQRAATVGIDGYRKVHNRIQIENSWAGKSKENNSPNRSFGDECFALKEGNTCNSFTVMRDPLSMHRVLANISSQATNASRSPRLMKGEINRNGNAFFTTSQWDSQDKRKESADGSQTQQFESPTYLPLKFYSVEDDYSRSDEQVQQAVSEECTFTDPKSFVHKIEENALMRVINEHEEDLKLMIFSHTGLGRDDLGGSQIGQRQDVQKTGRDLGYIKIRLEDDELVLDTSSTPGVEISPEVTMQIDPTRNLTGSDNSLVSSDVAFPEDVKQPDRHEVDGTKTRPEDADIRAEMFTVEDMISSQEEPKAAERDDNILNAMSILTENQKRRLSEGLSDWSLTSSLFLGIKRRLRRPGTFLPYIKSQDYFPMPPSHCLPKFPRIRLPIPWGVPPELPGANRISPHLKPAIPFQIFPPEKVMAFSYQLATKHYSTENDSRKLKLL